LKTDFLKKTADSEMSHFSQDQASGPWGLRPGGEIKGLRGDVHVVRRTRNPADLSASGGL